MEETNYVIQDVFNSTEEFKSLHKGYWSALNINLYVPWESTSPLMETIPAKLGDGGIQRYEGHKAEKNKLRILNF